MNPLVVAAYRALHPFYRNQPGVDGTFGAMHSLPLPALATNSHLGEFAVRGIEPPGRGQDIEQIEHNPCRGTRAGKPGAPFAARVARPHGDEVFRGNTDRPTVPEPVTGSRLPSYFPERRDKVPV